MVSSISAYGGSTASLYAPARGSRPDPAQMQAELFKQLDSNDDGSIDKTELSSVLSSASASEEGESGGAIDIDALFSLLDADSDGSISQSESAALAPPPPPRDGRAPAGLSGADTESTPSQPRSGDSVQDRASGDARGGLLAALFRSVQANAGYPQASGGRLDLSA